MKNYLDNSQDQIQIINNGGLIGRIVLQKKVVHYILNIEINFF